ncbi:hypothetical protein Ddye_009208 [Dipteronia dyeriana]|uniref:Trichome birefringence-like N-terminal domain-containing protein n=1 Tax=Dipteronia dyeriana TaxID=168575 RepID=A0AAE0CM34_9ROSI|nr:hypothetical protein Ddye_009208 [Dipteronia dyeriana]
MRMIEKMSSFSRSKSFTRSTSFNRRTLSLLSVGTPISLSFGSPRVRRTSCVSQWFRMLIVVGSLVSFLVVVGGGYVYVLPSLTQAVQGDRISDLSNSMVSCDFADGSWIIDDNYPLYNASECPFAEQGFNCLGNGRRDNGYLKWKWKPKNCEITRFNVHSILEWLRSKRVVFVGDSMSRTQWESLICLLMTGVEDKKSVYEINGNKITKRIRFLGVRFSSFNFTIEFFRSVFLVQHGWMPRHAPKRVRSTLKLDKMDDISNEWINADILIFNTGQWWVPGKLFETGCYFQVENSLKLGMSIPTAFRIALGTWASWAEKMIDKNRTRVFFRTFEPSHWSDKLHRFCNVTQSPIIDTKDWDRNIFSHSILEVVKNMTVPITVLHVTSMSAFRSDAHVGMWSDNPSVPDCSHWCLPGVPDVWNEILFSYLLDGLWNLSSMNGSRMI